MLTAKILFYDGNRVRAVFGTGAEAITFDDLVDNALAQAISVSVECFSALRNAIERLGFTWEQT